MKAYSSKALLLLVLAVFAMFTFSPVEAKRKAPGGGMGGGGGRKFHPINNIISIRQQEDADDLHHSARWLS